MGGHSFIDPCRASLAYLGIPLRQVEATLPSPVFRKLSKAKIAIYELKFTLLNKISLIRVVKSLNLAESRKVDVLKLLTTGLGQGRKD